MITCLPSYVLLSVSAVSSSPIKTLVRYRACFAFHYASSFKGHLRTSQTKVLGFWETLPFRALALVGPPAAGKADPRPRILNQFSYKGFGRAPAEFFKIYPINLTFTNRTRRFFLFFLRSEYDLPRPPENEVDYPQCTTLYTGGNGVSTH